MGRGACLPARLLQDARPPTCDAPSRCRRLSGTVRRYEQYCMDEFPNGTNAVVAVLAYTGAPGARRGGGAGLAFSATGWAAGQHRLLGAARPGTHASSRARCRRPSIAPARPARLRHGGRHDPEQQMCCKHSHAFLYSTTPCRAGYDMEDAMILNKSAVERGFAHAYLYKTEQIDLREERGRCGGGWRCMGRLRRPGWRTVPSAGVAREGQPRAASACSACPHHALHHCCPVTKPQSCFFTHL